MTGARARASLVLAASTLTLACRHPAGADRREIAADEDCVVCHQADYDATSMPPHPGLFTTECHFCHSTEAWVPALALQHDWFVLANRHAEIACTDCHTVGFAPGDTPSTCYGCHQPDYEMATAPPHAGYPTDCATCHTDAGWRPSTFVHPWPLDGAHVLISCASCHVGDPPQWAGLPRECVGCHRDDYDASPYPGHATFPTTCADCHSTTAWTPAIEGAHPEARFPIANGAHEGYACTDCHDPALGPSSMGMNCDCVGCHEGEHARARVDEQHREVPDYPRGAAPPNFCLVCHPDGRN